MDDAAFKNHVVALKAACRAPDIAAELHLQGRGKRFFCPACQADGAVHRTPDLDVFDEGFKCYKCGVKGDVIDLVVLAGRMTKPDAIRYLEERTGLSRPKKTKVWVEPRSSILGAPGRPFPRLGLPDERHPAKSPLCVKQSASSRTESSTPICTPPSWIKYAVR